MKRALKKRGHVAAVLAFPSTAARNEERRAELTTIAAGRVRAALAPGESLTVDTAEQRLMVRLPYDAPRQVNRRLEGLSRAAVVDPVVCADGSRHWLETGVGWARVPGAYAAWEDAALESAIGTAHDALRQRDLVPKRSDRRHTARGSSAGTLAAQIALSLLLVLGLPLVLLAGVRDVFGVDLALPLYWLVVTALVITAVLLWLESTHALKPTVPPPLADRRAAPASAIIAAYLPNEADTILETLRHFLRLEYSGDLQIILAYNCPAEHPMEARLHALARTEPRLRVFKVADSTSKAQNVNAALPLVRGEFVGVFDADHHPMPGAFERARAWIQTGADVVQGHCVVRNGARSLVGRTVAVEFEQIYAVSHPGRAALHGFGIFGGSNGYWRTSVLRAVRMRTDRLTEDIDASIRASLSGHRIVSDPDLLSYELAPLTLRSLWRQRSRWAQGWTQVSRVYLAEAVRSEALTRRQQLGMFLLLGWREIIPWITPLALPLAIYTVLRDGAINWSAVMLLTLAFTLASGPIQVFVAYLRAAEPVRRHGWWFLAYVFVSVVVYSEFKNMIMRIAQLKQLRREHDWAVTPRTERPAEVPEVSDPSLPIAA